MKLTWPASARNRGPILDVLARVMPDAGTLLEVASGSGEHVVNFARHLSGLTFLPSDVSEARVASIREWVEESRLENILPPILLDVLASDWHIERVDAVFCANMIHITPWECSLALFEGVRRYLASGGTCVLYGPFRIAGAHTAASNAQFDENLKRRDARWGVRDLEAVTELAHAAELELIERVEMPANNQTLVFRRVRRSYF
jgi:cyclopropane fatty-acyl-phospholipid synthase-like methyltransferase